MSESRLQNLLESLQGAVKVQENGVKVTDEKLLKDKISVLIYKAVFGDEAEKGIARWLIWEAAQELGIRPASIHDLYLAAGVVRHLLILPFRQ